jgi:hypothetical protein
MLSEAGNIQSGELEPDIALRWVYAGELGPDGKLDWGGMPGGSIPERGMVPDLYATELYVLVRRLAWAGEYGGRDPDWDASAIRVNGRELRVVLDQAFGADTVAAATGDLAQYRDLADRLGDRCVALVTVAF